MDASIQLLIRACKTGSIARLKRTYSKIYLAYYDKSFDNDDYYRNLSGVLLDICIDNDLIDIKHLVSRLNPDLLQQRNYWVNVICLCCK